MIQANDLSTLLAQHAHAFYSSVAPEYRPYLLEHELTAFSNSSEVRALFLEEVMSRCSGDALRHGCLYYGLRAEQAREYDTAFFYMSRVSRFGGDRVHLCHFLIRTRLFQRAWLWAESDAEREQIRQGVGNAVADGLGADELLALCDFFSTRDQQLFSFVSKQTVYQALLDVDLDTLEVLRVKHEVVPTSKERESMYARLVDRHPSDDRLKAEYLVACAKDLKAHDMGHRYGDRLLSLVCARGTFAQCQEVATILDKELTLEQLRDLHGRFYSELLFAVDRAHVTLALRRHDSGVSDSHLASDLWFGLELAVTTCRVQDVLLFRRELEALGEAVPPLAFDQLHHMHLTLMSISSEQARASAKTVRGLMVDLLQSEAATDAS